MQALRSTLGFASKATARKPRVVVLGSGWGGNKVARYLDKSKFDVRVVSPCVEIKFCAPHAIDATLFDTGQPGEPFPVHAVAAVDGRRHTRIQSRPRTSSNNKRPGQVPPGQGTEVRRREPRCELQRYI